MALRLQMHFEDEGTRRIESKQIEVFGRLDHAAGDSVCRKDHGLGRWRNFVQLFHKNGAFCLKGLDDVTIMDDLVTHVDWSAILGERQFDDLDRPIDPGAETARGGQEHIQARLLRSIIRHVFVVDHVRRSRVAGHGAVAEGQICGYAHKFATVWLADRRPRVNLRINPFSRRNAVEDRIGMVPLNGRRRHLGRHYADDLTMTQSMPASPRWGRAGTAAALMCAASLLGGCGISSLTSGLGSGVFGGSQSAKTETGSVSEEQLLSAAQLGDGGPSTGGSMEVAHGCPKFQPWPRDNLVTVYEPGREGDGLAIMHRGEITKTARECMIEPGRVTVKYGFSGRILLGPRGKPGPITLPVSVFVTDAKRDRITTDRLQVDTNVSIENPIGYFSAVRTVTFDIPQGSRPGEYEVFVGFERAIPGAG